MIHKGSKLVNTECTVMITRTMGSGPSDLRLQIEDKKSGQLVCEIRLDELEGLNLFTNRIANGDAKIYKNDNLGKRQEVKTELMNLGGYSSTDDKNGDLLRIMIEDFAKKYHEGWTPDIESYNWHRSQKGKYQVTLRRWV